MADLAALHVVVDGGVDDAVALAVLVGSGTRMAQVVATEGSRPLDQTAATTARLMSGLGSPVPVRLGADAALSGPYPEGRDPFHGEDCFAGQSGLLPGAEVPSERWAPLDGPVFAAGALTVVAAAVLAGDAVGDVVWMGGSVAWGGNMTAAAEFNAWMDPAAADELFRRGYIKRMVPLDVTERCAFESGDIRRLQACSPAGALVGAAGAVLCGRDGNFVPHDAVTAAAFLRPELFSWKQREVRCETQGLVTRGETVVDRRPWSAAGATLVAEEVDVAGVKSLIFDAVAAGGYGTGSTARA